MPTEVVLIVENASDISPKEKAIHNRLTERLGYQVQIADALQDRSSFNDGAMVVVCSRHAPGDLRHLSAPVLVCNIEALYDLGMTMAKKDKDFGTLAYSSIVVGKELFGEATPAELVGRNQITTERSLQGWARPGSRALVMATVGGDNTKAVVFAYDKGDAMSGGLEAPNRRGAFLAFGDEPCQHHANGWELFDLVAKGIAVGGRWKYSPGPADLWFMQDGSPTRALAVEEYRDWVDAKVANEVYNRLLFYGKISLGGFAAFIISATVWFHNQVNSKADDIKKTLTHDTTTQIKEKVNDLDKELTSKINIQTASLMADLLFSKDPKMKQAVEIHLQTKGQEKFEELLKNNETFQEKITTSLEGLLEKEGIAADKMLRLYELQETSEAKRSLSLRLAHLYATNKHVDRLREIARVAILSEAKEESTRTTALEIFEPYNEREKDKNALLEIVECFASKQRSAPFSIAFGTLLSKFPDEHHAEDLLRWLVERFRAPEPPGTVRVDPAATPAEATFLAISRLKIKKKGEPKVLRLLVDYAVDQDEKKRSWGIAGLQRTTDDLQAKVENERVRKDLLTSLLRKINDPYITDTGNDPDKNARDLGKLLFGLLRSTDEDYVADALAPGMRSESKAIQELLDNYTARLERENKPMPSKVVDKLFGVHDALKGKGTYRAILYTVKQNKTVDAQKFLTLVPTLVPEPSRLSDMLVWAIEKDAEDLFSGTIKLLDAQSTLSSEESKKIVKQITTAMETFSKSSRRKFPDIHKLQAAMGEIDQKRKPLIHNLITESRNRVLKTLLGNLKAAKQWDQALKASTSLIQLFPMDPEYRYERALIYSDELTRREDSIMDLDEAIRLDSNKFKYWEKRGEIYRSMPGMGPRATAIADFNKAIKAIETMEPKAGNQADAKTKKENLARLYYRLASLYILEENNIEAKNNTDKSVEISDNLRDKAGRQENLGLLFLRQKNWEEAFNNTTKVNQWDTMMPWNWIIRYIAAKESQDEKIRAEAPKALEAWKRIYGYNDLAGLNLYIPDLLKTHLGVREVIPGTLEGPANLPTINGSKLSKLHPYKFESGKRYIVDMESRSFDSFLNLKKENSIIHSDDDKGGALNARIQFDCDKTGEYQIEATSFGGRSQGTYTLIIREEKK